MAHVSKKSAMMGKTEGEVFTMVRQTFPSYEYIVVWTMSTYEIFRAGMKRADIRVPRHTVLVFKDILGLITMDQEKNMGFETVLKKAVLLIQEQKLYILPIADTQREKNMRR